MPKGSGINKKFQPTGPLADIVGSKPLSYSEAMKKWNAYIRKHELKGEKGDGYSLTYGGRKYVGGQIIHCGEDPAFKKFCGGKQRVSMVQLGKFAKKYMKEI